VSQAAGFCVLAAVAAFTAGAIEGRSIALGLAAGVCGGAGVAAFYKALSLGTMSVVSPVVACGAVVPFGVSLATGERPSALALAGAAIALAGAVLASVEEGRSDAANRGRAVLLAVVAAVALGLFAYFLGLGSREGSALWTLAGARVASLSFLLMLAGARRAPLRIPRRLLVPVALVGILDVSANALFALASSRGLLALVSVLGSLFPIVTVLLALALLHERLTRVQAAGVAVALTGVAVLSVG